MKCIEFGDGSVLKAVGVGNAQKLGQNFQDTVLYDMHNGPELLKIKQLVFSNILFVSAPIVSTTKVIDSRNVQSAMSNLLDFLYFSYACYNTFFSCKFYVNLSKN